MSKLSYMSIKGQGLLLTLDQGRSDIKIKFCFFKKPMGILNPDFI